VVTVATFCGRFQFKEKFVAFRSNTISFVHEYAFMFRQESGWSIIITLNFVFLMLITI